METIILATRNKGKVQEICTLLNDLPIKFISLLDIENFTEIIEDGATYEENAKIKAEQIFDKLGIPTIADDSGLEVDALNGIPGIHSARYAGIPSNPRENIRKLLQSLNNVPKHLRGAQFRCVAAYKDDHIEYLAQGICMGSIAFEPKGVGGFGYDPIFIPEGFEQTFGEISQNIKNSISHRAKAFCHLKDFLRKLL